MCPVGGGACAHECGAQQQSSRQESSRPCGCRVGLSHPSEVLAPQGAFTSGAGETTGGATASHTRLMTASMTTTWTKRWPGGYDRGGSICRTGL